jgi:hypothetical protein
VWAFFIYAANSRAQGVKCHKKAELIERNILRICGNSVIVNYCYCHFSPKYFLEGSLMKNYNGGIIAMVTVLLVASFLVMSCGGKDPAKIQSEIEKLSAEALELAQSGDAADALKAAKISARALKLAAELEKAQKAAAGKPAKAPKGSNKEAPATDFQYDLNASGDGVVIKKYLGAGGKVVIPAKIEGIPVVELGTYVFSSNETLSAVVIPDSVTKFTDDKDDYGNNHGSQFYKCNALTSVVLSKNLKNISKDAFAFCSKLTSIDIPNGVESISKSAFQFCAELTSIDIPEGV